MGCHGQPIVSTDLNFFDFSGEGTLSSCHGKQDVHLVCKAFVRQASLLFVQGRTAYQDSDGFLECHCLCFIAPLHLAPEVYTACVLKDADFLHALRAASERPHLLLPFYGRTRLFVAPSARHVLNIYCIGRVLNALGRCCLSYAGVRTSRFRNVFVHRLCTILRSWFVTSCRC